MITTILTAGAVLGILALTGMGVALARGAALADLRMPAPPHAAKTPAPAVSSPSAPPVPQAPKTPARALDASEIRARVLAEKWHREGRLSHAGYLRLCELMYSGQDAYPYMSGGSSGTAVVWDGTRGGPHSAGERLTVEQWNALAEHDTGVQGGASASEGAQGVQGGAA